MWDFLNKFIKWIVGAVFFLAALATIAGYLETSKKWPEIAGMFSATTSPEFLEMIYRLLFLCAAAISLWWLNRRLELVEGSLRKLEGQQDMIFAPELRSLIIHSAMYGLGPGR